MLNIQQKDNKTIVTYKDTFKQNVEVLKTHLPMSIVHSYVESTDTYKQLTDHKSTITKVTVVLRFVQQSPEGKEL